MNKIHPITDYRKRHGLTLAAFGTLAGVQKAQVWKWEKGVGVPSIKSAKRIDKNTQGQLPKWLLRPDVWAADDKIPASM